MGLGGQCLPSVTLCNATCDTDCHIQLHHTYNLNAATTTNDDDDTAFPSHYHHSTHTCHHHSQVHPHLNHHHKQLQTSKRMNMAPNDAIVVWALGMFCFVHFLFLLTN